MAKQPSDAVANPRAIIAQFRAGELSPLQTARRLHSVFEFSLERDRDFASRWPQALTAANAEATVQYFIGKDVDIWHPDLREQKRAQLNAAEERWRTPVEEACSDLLIMLDEDRAFLWRRTFYLASGIVLAVVLIWLLRRAQ